MSARRFTFWTHGVRLIAALLVVGLAAALYACGGVVESAHAADGSSATKTAEIRVPEASVAYRLRVERAAAEYFGVEASPSRLAAQLHQESGWKPKAQSKYAVGLAQFTPATAAWLPKVCPELGAFDPWDPNQAINGAACYDRWLLSLVDGATPCDEWAFALSGYNGGLGWVQRDKQRASAKGADPMVWFGGVDAHSARAAWAFKENRGYPKRILLHIEPAYIKAGWPGTAICQGVSP